MLPCHAGLLTDSIPFFVAPTGYCLEFGRMISYLGKLRGSFSDFLKQEVSGGRIPPRPVWL
jgi:hypothetical protein